MRRFSNHKSCRYTIWDQGAYRIKSARIPKYRKHKPTGQAVVVLSGHFHYLGPYGTKASRLEYARVVNEWLAAGRVHRREVADTTVPELLLAYTRWAKQHYRRNGKPTGTFLNQRGTIRALRRMYGHLPVNDFSPLKLEAFRLSLFKPRKVMRGENEIVITVTRRHLNRQIKLVKRIFKWGVTKEIVHPDVATAIGTIGLET